MTAASPHGDEVRLQVAALCWRRRPVPEVLLVK